jgi:hypothetical protein
MTGCIYDNFSSNDIVSTFHIIIIIHQSFNGIFFWKFEQLVNLEHIFNPFFIYNFLKTLCSAYNKLNEVLYDFKMYFK